MFFIINPTAARGRAMRDWIKARKELIRLGVNVTEQLTTRPGEAVEITRQALMSDEVFLVAVGGDGTLNEVVNGFFGENDQPINPAVPIGLLPCGTGSDFHRSLGMKKLKGACRTLAFAKTKPIDLLKVELADQNGQPISRYAINAVSFGLGGEVVSRVNSWRESLPRWLGGFPRFALASLKALKTYQNRPVKVLLEDKPLLEKDVYIFSNFLVVTNGQFAGSGMKFAPDAKIDDGLMDVVMTDNASRWDIIKELPKIRSGAHIQNPKVKIAQSNDVVVQSWPPMPVEIDGEVAGFTPARLTIKPAALHFIVDRYT